MAAFNANYEAIGNQLVQHYYATFDVNDPNQRVQGLGSLYDPENSYMTFEGVQVRGRDAILAKFQSLTFQRIQRSLTKTDTQPLYDGSILVSVLGQLKTDDDPIQSYNQLFIVRPNPAGGYFIANEVFRLVLHNN